MRLLIEPGGTPVVAGSPVDGNLELTAEALAAGIPLELAERVVVLLHLFDRALGDAAEPLGMTGGSAGIQRVRAAIERGGDRHLLSRLRRRSRRDGGAAPGVQTCAEPQDQGA